MQILILNGPNLNLVGKREPEIYGTQSLDDYLEILSKNFEEHEIIPFQSNHEGALIDKIHEYGFHCDGIIINAGGYSHTSIALADAIQAVPAPAVEVHISDISKREEFRHFTYLKDVCIYHIIGKGLEGYQMALEHLIQNNMPTTKA